MWFLLGTTLTASFFDSLNPSAIAQQMLLQAMVKKKRHIWFFICGIGTANLIMGLAIYYGMYEKNGQPMEKLLSHYLQARFLRPKIRPYKTNNYYAILMRGGAAHDSVLEKE